MKIKSHTLKIGLAVLVSYSAASWADTQDINWAKSLLLSLGQSPQWQQLEANLDSAKAAKDAAMQPIYNPELEISYDDKTDRAYQVTLSQKIDLYDKRSSRSQIAAIQEQISALQNKQTKTELAKRSLTSLIQTRRAEELLQLAEQELVISQRLIKLTQQKIQAGDANQLDLEFVKVALSDAINAKNNAQKDLQLSRAQQQSLIGDLPLKLPEKLVHDLPTTPDFSTLSTQSYLVKISTLQAQLAQLQIRQSVAESKSEPTLGLGMGQDGNDDVLALSITFPLNVRNNYQSEIRAAESNAKASDYAVTQHLIEVENLLRQNWNVVEQQKSLQSLLQKTQQKGISHLSQKLEKLWQIGELNTSDYLQNLRRLNTSLATDVNLSAESNLSLIEWLSSSNQLIHWLTQQ
jgi:cobalt-zinc-cadmium efflux system outer membrane protein